MLGKLIKHEFKATSRFLVPLYLILMVLSIVNRIVLTLDLFDGALAIIRGFVTVTFVISLIGIAVVTFVLMVMRFYKNLLSDEGYLMFTLPVKAHQLITSKLLISMLFMILSILAILVSLLIVFATPDRMDLLSSLINHMKVELQVVFRGNIPLLVIETVLIMLIGIVHNILMIYVSIAVGQLFNGHKLLGSFAAYIGINTAVQTFITGILFVGSLILRRTINELEAIPQIIFPISILISILLSSAYFFATDYIFKKKLNLE